jgi:rhamnogalacturonyl hydrolase YesR
VAHTALALFCCSLVAGGVPGCVQEELETLLPHASKAVCERRKPEGIACNITDTSMTTTTTTNNNNNNNTHNIGVVHMMELKGLLALIVIVFLMGVW